MLFAFKQIISDLIIPFPFAALLIACGLLARFAKRNRLYRILVLAGCSTVVISSIGVTGNGLLLPLENRYSAIVNIADVNNAPRYIAVLGSGYRPRDGLPITAALDPTGMVRLAEGVRLCRLLPRSTLVVSGGSFEGREPVAYGYAKAAEALGVPRKSIITVDSPLDTSGEAIELRKLIGDAPVLIVTSASHMPRAMAYLRRNNVRAIPAPTGHIAEPLSTWGIRMWLFPSGVNLRKTEIAIHEYVGLIAFKTSAI